MSILNISLGIMCFILAIVNYRSRKTIINIDNKKLIRRGTILTIVCTLAGILLVTFGWIL